MVKRGTKPRRRRPRRKVHDSFVAWLRRLALYGAALLILAGGSHYHAGLRESADTADAAHQSLSVFEGALKPDALRERLAESESDEAETKAILSAVRKATRGMSARKGDAYRVVRSTDGAFLHLTLTRGKKRIVVTQSSGTFRTRLLTQPLFKVERTEHGTIKSSLWLSMSRMNVPDELIQEFADVFQWTIDFLTEPRDGDTFAVTWSETRTPDGRVWSRDIQAARYVGQKTDDRTGILFNDYYYDGNGESLQRMFLRAPLTFRRISSQFSSGRWHPILRKRRPHNGIDYAAPRGTPVVAVGGGLVTAVGRRGGYGKRVEIRHNGVYSTLYGHLDGYGKGISGGARVQQGQVIGYVGSTGLASGPHLHFQVSKNGNWVDFLHLKLPKTKKIAVKDKESFYALRDKYLPLLGVETPKNAAGSGR